jgi:hypothetical protein
MPAIMVGRYAVIVKVPPSIIVHDVHDVPANTDHGRLRMYEEKEPYNV